MSFSFVMAAAERWYDSKMMKFDGSNAIVEGAPTKEAFGNLPAHQRKHRKKRPDLEVISTENLHTEKGRKELIEALQRDGCVLIRPYSVSITITQCQHAYVASRHFFGIPMRKKEASREPWPTEAELDKMLQEDDDEVMTEELLEEKTKKRALKIQQLTGRIKHGYTNELNDPSRGRESFECKVHHELDFFWPDFPVRGVGPSKPRTVKTAWCDIMRHLITNAKHALEGVVTEMDKMLDHKHIFYELLDMDAGNAIEEYENDPDRHQVGSSSRLRHDLANCSNSAMTVQQYSYGVGTDWKTDDTLLTIMPAGSAVGIKTRFLDGREWYPETTAEMERQHSNVLSWIGGGDGDMLCFAGEQLSYLTGGAIPALMYRVDPPRTKPEPGETPPLALINFMFRLRGRRNQDLKPPHPLPRIPVHEIESNKDGLCDKFFWKKDSPYYTQEGGPHKLWAYELPKWEPIPSFLAPPVKAKPKGLRGGFFVSKKKGGE